MFACMHVLLDSMQSNNWQGLFIGTGSSLTMSGCLIYAKDHSESPRDSVDLWQEDNYRRSRYLYDE